MCKFINSFFVCLSALITETLLQNYNRIVKGSIDITGNAIVFTLAKAVTTDFDIYYYIFISSLWHQGKNPALGSANIHNVTKYTAESGEWSA